MAFQVTSTSINPNHAKGSTYMALRNPVVLRLTLATVALITCSCVTVTLVPGADKVKLTHNAADVAACKAVGNVSAQPTLIGSSLSSNYAIELSASTEMT